MDSLLLEDGDHVLFMLVFLVFSKVADMDPNKCVKIFLSNFISKL